MFAFEIICFGIVQNIFCFADQGFKEGDGNNAPRAQVNAIGYNLRR